MQLARFISLDVPKYTEAFLRLLYPSVCALCGQLLHLEMKGLCSVCLTSFSELRLSPVQERIRISLDHGSEAWALFRYDRQVRDLVRLIKFHGRRDLLSLFEKPLTQFFTRHPHLASLDLIVPVPLDFWRRIHREFDQAHLLASQIQRIFQKIYGRSGTPRLARRFLIKKHPSLPQSLMSREARQANVLGAFSVRGRSRLSGRSLLLVDDVFTSGATLEEAGKILKVHGVETIVYLSLARAVAS